MPPHLSFLFFSLKKFPEKERHFKYFIYLCTQIPVRSRRVDAFFLKREIIETRTWEGIGVVTYKAFTRRFVLDELKLRKLHE